MEFLLIIGLIVLIAVITPKPHEVGGANGSNQFVVQKKQCPPHQWFWQEIVDQDGNKQGERICCKVCGPMRPLGGRDEG